MCIFEETLVTHYNEEKRETVSNKCCRSLHAEIVLAAKVKIAATMCY